MKTILKSLSVAACLAIGTCAYAQEGFLRPELSYNFAKLSGSDITGIDLKDALGYGVAAGVRLGAQNEHEIGLSVGILDFSTSTSVPGVSLSGKVKTIPILANYRYYFGAKADSIRVYLAPSAGYSDLRADVTATAGGISSRASSSGTDFTWSAGVGALFKVADKVDIDVGYRYLEIQETHANIQVNGLYAGLNYRF